jgi:hypothetical protein
VERLALQGTLSAVTALRPSPVPSSPSEGSAYGTLAGGLDFASIVERHTPQ